MLMLHSTYEIWPADEHSSIWNCRWCWGHYIHTYIFCALGWWLGCYCFFKAMTKCIVPWHGTLLCGSRLPCNVWPSSVWALTINSCSCLLMHDAGLKSRHVKRNFLWASDNRVAKRSWLFPSQILLSIIKI